MSKGLKGKVIAGRYEILSLLGSGTFASVWRARQVQTDGEVAIKILSPGYATDPALVEEFLSEAKRYVAFRDQPNLATVLEVGQDEETGFYFVVMTLLDKTVDDMIQEGGPLSPERIYRMAEDVASALILIHGSGVVHRDIKGTNIMAKDERFVVTDFGLGLVQEVADRTAPTRDIRQSGTWSYSSPEQIKAQRKEDIGPSADLYSFGVVLYKAATGEFPFEPSFPQVIHDHLKTPAPDPCAKREDLPPELAQVILKLLEKDPKKRYESAEAFREAIREAQIEKEEPTGLIHRFGTRTIVAFSVMVVSLLALATIAILASNRTFSTEIVSDPAGATFRVWEGQQRTRFDALASGTTPGEVSGLKPGPYTVVVEKEGFFSEDRTRELTHDEHEFGSFSLEPMHSYRVITDPPGASVVLMRMGETRQKVGEGRSPIEFTGLHAGPHEVTYALENFKTVVETVKVGTEADTTSRRLVGTALVTVEIHSNPSAAEVFIDGTRVSAPTPCRIPNLPSGPRSFRFVAEGYGSFDTTVVLPPEPSVQNLTVDLAGRGGRGARASESDRAQATDGSAAPDANATDSRDTGGESPSADSRADARPEETRTQEPARTPSETAEDRERRLQEERLARLRRSIPQRIREGDWVQANAELGELLQEGGADAQAQRWRSQVDAALQGGEVGQAVRNEIDHAITLYEQALESLDVNQYARLWISLSGNERRAIEREFESLESQQIDIRDTTVDVDGIHATVSFQEVRERKEQSGDQSKAERTAVLRLRRMGGGEWLISGLDYR